MHSHKISRVFGKVLHRKSTDPNASKKPEQETPLTAAQSAPPRPELESRPNRLYEWAVTQAKDRRYRHNDVRELYAHGLAQENVRREIREQMPEDRYNLTVIEDNEEATRRARERERERANRNSIDSGIGTGTASRISRTGASFVSPDLDTKELSAKIDKMNINAGPEAAESTNAKQRGKMKWWANIQQSRKERQWRKAKSMEYTDQPRKIRQPTGRPAPKKARDRKLAVEEIFWDPEPEPEFLVTDKCGKSGIELKYGMNVKRQMTRKWQDPDVSNDPRWKTPDRVNRRFYVVDWNQSEEGAAYQCDHVGPLGEACVECDGPFVEGPGAGSE